MSKSLTLSMSLVLALGFSGVSFAGHKSAGCETCGLASPQGVVASPQGSPQGYAETSCGTCAPAKKKCFLDCFKPKPKMYTYEYVLKKKKVHGHKGAETCDSCGSYGSSVMPSSQFPSPQGGIYPAPQGHAYPAPQYGAPQGGMGAPQTALAPTSEMKAPEAPAGDAVPPAPPTPPSSTPPPAGGQAGLLILSPTGN